MKVLVTGGCGFLGSHVCEYYAGKGAKVVSYDNMTKHELTRTGYAAEAARRYNWEYLKAMGVKMVKADVRDFDELMDRCEGADYIIHTAAQPAMTISWEDPRLDFMTNALGTFNVLEAARLRKIPVASCASVHVYGNAINETLKEGSTRYMREPKSISESHPTLEGTITPLHASKGAGDIYVKTYIDTYGVEAASFRLTGIYGPRQFGGEDHGWVANFSIRAAMGWPITLYGSGKQVRDILYATDVCEAFDAFYKTRRPGIYNVGGGAKFSISLIECIGVIREVFKKDVEVRYAESRHGDLKYFVCDTAKALRELEWDAKIRPRQGVAMLMEWIEANRNLFTGEQAV